ncbi:putative sorting nexin-21-like [Apostichopus japonicus]|uniref:Putative sorting nexin-21-like n=1 Tax=Stichopus japonicus TaxID=307972 RepID=A0A2G8K3N4_STIJA|nr:putative sorting nexin-21-like [Apostichopus japonicus]
MTFNDGLGLDGMGIPGDSDLGDDEGDDGLNDDDDGDGDDDTGSQGASFSSLPSGRNFKIYGVSELCPYGDEEKTLSSSKPAFSVTSAKTMKDGHKKFVHKVDKLVISPSCPCICLTVVHHAINHISPILCPCICSYSCTPLPSIVTLDRHLQATIEKRYSDFLDLHKQLTKLFPQVMEHIYFPRKAFTGNFRHQFIAERSRAFEQYLSHIYTSEDIRLSMPYQDFFYATDIRRAYKFMSEGKFQEAIPLLQNASHLQAKLLGEEYPDTVVTFSL